MEYAPSTVNINQLWADLMVSALIRSGIHHFFISPGSRSTPLTVAIARHPDARKVIHPDERGTAFAALGFARATGKPAVWVTTSGTAVANGLPAVVEASNDRIPMLLLTADRPPELRETDANQTIRQTGIFGAFVRWAFDMPCPDVAIPAQMVLSTVRYAASQSLQQKGPVHLNCMFREPLAPHPDPFDHKTYLAPLQTQRENHPSANHLPAHSPSFPMPPFEKKGIVILGQWNISSVEVPLWLQRLSALNWPILPDIGSQFRTIDHPLLIPYYDQLLLSASFQESHAPEVVLQIGSRFTSKRLQKWLEQVMPESYFLVKDHPFRSDPAHLVTHFVEANPTTYISNLSIHSAAPTQTDWLIGWQSANQRVSEVLPNRLDTEVEVISEPYIVRALSRLLPEGHAWFLGNSMPIRDADMYAKPSETSVAIGTNRGASGIDGLVATAVGFAIGRKQPLTLLIGDVSLLHDLNSLLMVRNSPVPITVVVINNDGGGIFSFLPIATEVDVFEDCFGTPHGRRFADVALFFGLPYATPTTPASFEATYRTMSTSGMSGLIEVRTNRAENVAFHKTLQADLLSVLDK